MRNRSCPAVSYATRICWSSFATMTRKSTHPYAKLDSLAVHFHDMHLYSSHCKLHLRSKAVSMQTLKSTPIVALASSSGTHCLSTSGSANRSSKLLFPTLEFPIRSSLQLMVCGLDDGGIISQETLVVVVGPQGGRPRLRTEAR